MSRKVKSEMEYTPFLITQIEEEQNVFIMAHKEILGQKIQFSSDLYNYIDLQEPASCLRIFKSMDMIHLSYFWLSRLKEPGSQRSGIYLIVGMSCKKETFLKNPDRLSQYFLAFYEYLCNGFDVDSRSSDSTQIVTELWRAFREEDIMKLSEQAFETYEEYINKQSINVPDSIPYIPKKHRWGACRGCIYIMGKGFANRVLCFVREASGWLACKKDIASKEGYGKGYIKLLSNGEEFPTGVKKVKIRDANTVPYFILKF